MIGIPFPAETTLTFSGIALAKGEFRLIPLILAAIVGNVFGSSIAYVIGRFLGRAVILRYGKVIGLTEERLSKAEERFMNHQVSILLISKFIAGIRVLTPYLAGLNGIPFPVFTLYNSIGAVIWVEVFVFLGRYVDVAWARYHAFMHRNLLPLILIALVIGGAVACIKLRVKKNAAK
ncbi:DedA family protein [Paenibacillus cremeus]|uniref:DedA family protein n=1 Tax=Paenibacillus cremeus TaxID=2163881 RepID=A0A559K4J1_9BACL|nr:DedA family protein [Paenibacillus cremeus]TVY07061.1 DedA family protein [Paenibacillus cremeus]